MSVQQTGQAALLRFRGTCWRFGDNIGVDGDMMPLRFAIERETRPDVLREHAMTALDPDFPRKAQPGDILVAGRRFAQGNPHIQGLLGLRGLGLGLVVESIPRGSFRNAINSGLPILPNCPGVTDEVETGETLEVDFITGTFRNVSRGTERQYEPLTPLLLDLVRAGGWEASFRSRLARLREAE
jgi:3-isopropylmalate/(R)-2-methylmalate dehydratase small subunit